MDCIKVFNLIQSRFKVRNWTASVISGIIFTLMSCSGDSDSIEDRRGEESEENPTLKIVNEITDNRYISSIKLVGYEFNSLNIASGNSQEFVLNNGMPGGYKDINTIVSYRTSTTPSNSKSITVNYEKGKITTITLKGCINYEGCNGYFLDYVP